MKIFNLIAKLEESGEISKQAGLEIRATANALRAERDSNTYYKQVTSAAPRLSVIDYDYVSSQAEIAKQAGAAPGLAAMAILKHAEQLSKKAQSEASNTFAATQFQPEPEPAEQVQENEATEDETALEPAPEIQDVSKIRERLSATYPPITKYDPDIVDENIRIVLQQNPNLIVDDPESTAKAIEMNVLSIAGSPQQISQQEPVETEEEEEEEGQVEEPGKADEDAEDNQPPWLKSKEDKKKPPEKKDQKKAGQPEKAKKEKKEEEE